MPQEKKKNPHQGHRERMKEKIKNQGVEHLPEHEVLEFLLYPFIPYKDTNPIAHELIDRFGNLSNVLDASPKVLLEADNMTENAALYLSVLPQIIKRYNIQKFGEKPVLDTIAHSAEYFQQLFLNEKEEAMYMLILNAKGMLLSSCKIGVGSVSACQLNTREFILRTADSQGKFIMLAHNHPSGSPLPSYDDCQFTRWLVSFAEVLGIELWDHIIISAEGYYSFKENNMLETYAGVFKEYMENAQAADKYSMEIRKFTDKK